MARCFIPNRNQFLCQLGEADLGIDHHRLHGRQVAERFKYLHGIEYTEGIFFDFVAKARGTAQHLVEQDAAIHPAQEYEIADFWHVDTGGEQIDRHRHIGISLVLVTANELQGFVCCAGDLDHCIVVHAAVLILKSLFE